MKIRHAFLKLQRIAFTTVSSGLQINDKQNTTFKFSCQLISNKMHEATFLISFFLKENMLLDHTELLLEIIDG